MVTNLSVQKGGIFLFNWIHFICPTSGQGGKCMPHEGWWVISSENPVLFVEQMSCKLVRILTTNSFPFSLRISVTWHWMKLRKCEKEKEANLFCPHCPPWNSNLLIRCLSSWNLLTMTLSLPGLPNGRFGTLSSQLWRLFQFIRPLSRFFLPPYPMLASASVRFSLSPWPK